MNRSVKAGAPGTLRKMSSLGMVGLGVFALSACGEGAKEPEAAQGPAKATRVSEPKRQDEGQVPARNVEKTKPGNQERTDLTESGQQPLSISFLPKVGSADLACSDKSDAMVAVGQIFTDVRLFVSNLSLVDGAGRVSRMALEPQDLQFTDGKGTSIALLNFLDAECASSDATRAVKTSLTGTVNAGQYKTLRFQLGLPYPAMDARLVAIPAAMAPSDMGWMWEHYPADLQIETNTGASRGSASKLLNALTREKKVTLELPINLSVGANGEARIAVNMDLAKMFPASGAAFASGLENACNNNTSLPSESDVNCAHAFKAFGFEVKGSGAPSAQTVFSVAP